MVETSWKNFLPSIFPTLPLQYNATLVDDVKVDNIFKVDDGSGNLRSSIKFS